MSLKHFYAYWWGFDFGCWTVSVDANWPCCFHVSLGPVTFGYGCSR